MIFKANLWMFWSENLDWSCQIQCVLNTVDSILTSHIFAKKNTAQAFWLAFVKCEWPNSYCVQIFELWRVKVQIETGSMEAIATLKTACQQVFEH